MNIKSKFYRKMDILQLTTGTTPISQSVDYSCVLTNTWSGARHPIGYDAVSGSAHWSPPVLMAHSKFANLWSTGDMASPGIESVAEMGLTGTLQNEVQVLQTKGLAGDMTVGVNQFNAVDPPQTLEPVTLSPSFPYLSSISMIAPSPDWFSGFDSFSPRGPGGYWLQSFELATYPFDAGTEMGEEYSINNEPESSQGPIYPLTRDTVPNSGILLDPTGAEVLPVATWKCTQIPGTEEFESTDDSTMMKETGFESTDDSTIMKEAGMMKETGMLKEEDPNGGFRDRSRLSGVRGGSGGGN